MRIIFSFFFSLTVCLCTYSQETGPEYQLIVFEGSDWCSNCRKFDKYILQNPSIIDYLKKEKISIVKVDFPQRKKLSKTTATTFSFNPIAKGYTADVVKKIWQKNVVQSGFLNVSGDLFAIGKN